MRGLSYLLVLMSCLLTGCGESPHGDEDALPAPIDSVAQSSCSLPAARTLYVSAAATAGGNGSRQTPFNTLQALEQASQAGDHLVVIPTPLQVLALDGGITLKPRQCLIGDGPPVVRLQSGAAVAGAAPLAALPRIRNTNLLRQNGDAVRLAQGSEVRNLVIVASARGGIYGVDVPGVVLAGNDISGFNTSCTIGFTVEPFSAPTRLPFFGVPLILPAGWAGILVDANSGSGTVTITDNYVHDGACGNGIDLRIRQTADYQAEISRNFVTQLKKGPGGETQELHLVHAITTQITNTARLTAYSADNVQTFIGGPGADCEGLFMNLSGSGYATWLIERNVFEHGIGGFSCNGVEAVISNGPAHGEMRIRDSRFIDNPGDMIQQDNLGTGSTLLLELDRIEVRDTSERPGDAAAQPLPFNLGECILAGSTGTGNITVLRVRDSDFSNCNSGLTLLSGITALNGTGPDGLMDVEVLRSRFRRNAYGNFQFAAITPLRELRLKVEDSDLGIAGDTTLSLRAIDIGQVETALIDFGGGALGSRGGNCIYGGERLDVLSQGLAAALHNNWWGQAGGPQAAKLSESQPGLLDIQSPLSRAPVICEDD